MRAWALFLAASILLCGCHDLHRLRTDISALPTRMGGEEAALVENLREAYAAMPDCVRTTPDVGCRKFDADLDAGKISDFVNAGMTLSDFYCDAFFRSANASARQRRFSRNVSNDVGGAIATVLGLAKASSGVVGGVAAGFSFADSGFRNYDESFMVDADLSKMRRLVLSAQDNMKLGIIASPPETIFAAESKVIRYAGLCSFLGMQDLLNESVAEKTRKIEADNHDRTVPAATSVNDGTSGTGVLVVPPPLKATGGAPPPDAATPPVSVPPAPQPSPG